MDNAAAREVFSAICHRLHANVQQGSPDQAEYVIRLPADLYRDPARFQKEIDRIFRQVPLLVALGCDVPEPGDFVTLTMIGHPLLIVRGDDGKARVFLNICRHRGAALTHEACGNQRVFTCPYHAWTYNRDGTIRGIPDSETFGDPMIDGLIQLPSDEAAGAIFASLNLEKSFTAAEWLGAEMLESLEALRLDDMHPYRRTSTLASPNWKLAADGYLDGYHIGLLHRNTIGTKAINNRNTYDLLGTHIRIGFANKGIDRIKTEPQETLNFPDCMSLVHYIFPNVSISGGHGDTIQLSRLHPGPGVNESTTVQYQYFREPVVGDMLEVAETKRAVYEQVVRDEDCETIFTISDALDAMSGTSPIVFGRNEPANQHLHRVISEMTDA